MREMLSKWECGRTLCEVIVADLKFALSPLKVSIFLFREFEQAFMGIVTPHASLCS